MHRPGSFAGETIKPGLRHVTIFFSDLAGFSGLAQRLGDVEAARIVNHLLTLQEIIITRQGAGQVLQFGGDSVFAVFNNASAALNRALEIQRVLAATARPGPENPQPKLRVGLHMGEVLLKEGDRMEIISRHVNRAHRVMESAAPGQILASEAVVEAGKDFVDVSREFLSIQYYGEYCLKGVGATSLCGVADSRFGKPQAPQIAESLGPETALVARLELAGYQCGGRLGEGAHGVVYQAVRDGNDRSLAIKVLHPVFRGDLAARQRFTREAARLRQASVPGVAQLLEVRLDHTPPFLVMELVAGKPIDEALEDAPATRIARVFRLVCEIVERAHAAGLIHCDLKPANILIQKEDKPVLLDFGLSVLRGASAAPKSSSTSLLGTPAYLAPELIQGREPGPFTDVYSLGAVLFKVLTGAEPFAGESVHEILQAHLHEDPPLPSALRPQVADGLQRICLKALEKNPEERYRTAGEMGADLERFLRGEVIHTRPTVYDNLLFHRVQQHLDQVNEWNRRGLLNSEEADRLVASYEGLQRRGLPAVMEGRMFRIWQTLVYLGGWAVINGSLLWLVQHWEALTRSGKLLLGSVPAVTAFALAAAMWRLERFRLTFVALVVGVLAVPLLVGVWLHEFQIVALVPEAKQAYEIFPKLTNLQLMLTAAAMFAAAASVMMLTRTTTHSAQALLALCLLYTTAYLLYGLKLYFDREEWAALAVRFVPLLLLVAGGAWLLLQRADRYHQAAPWIYSAAALFLAITCGVSFFGLKDWTHLNEAFRRPASWLLLSWAGAVQAGVGLLARSVLRHRCRMATLAVILVGLVDLLAGLALAGSQENWPKDWWSPHIFATPVPVTHLALPLVSFMVTLLACRYQMFAFLLVGLLGLASSIHLLGALYFEAINGWPKLIILAGVVCFFLALYAELRRTRGNALDDAINQTRL